ncbi:unnamed protein product [Prorocentrum cordatum]|uniref:PAS domain-containing protein n=1 Tax=Prorocentrum cordatum TaxID=2364126 RepID=A0ABN9VAB2_9DINO|nr:unnamed protein product [Polarella glacialis]
MGTNKWVRLALNGGRRVMAANDDRHDYFDRVSMPICGVDLTGEITAWNPRIAKLSGISREDAAGKPLVEFIAPESKSVVQNMIKQACNNLDSTKLVWLNAKGNGCSEVLFSASAWSNEQGSIRGCTLFVLDMSDLREDFREHEFINRPG